MDLKETIERLKAVSDTPVLDARLLMAHADPQNLEKWVQRRLNHEPVSKIIGVRGFWKSDFITTKAVLDPRPDTEIVIEAVLKMYPNKTEKKRMLDIGIGSGCILYSLLDEYPNAEGVGIDKSEAALSVAEENRKNRKADLLIRDFTQPDWSDGLGLFDIIVSNPPYIPSADICQLSPEVQQYDPIMALDGGKDGLDAYRVLAETTPQLMKSDGMAFFEVGLGQADSVINLFSECGLIHQETHRDYGGVDRIISFRKA